MTIGRRQFSTALAKSLAGALALPAAWAHAKDTALPIPASLPQAARSAQAKGEPLVLLISLPGCVYCEQVRRSYLLPMRADKGVGLQAWQLNVQDTTTTLIGFNGRRTTAAQQATAWKATFTPTVLFFGSEGQELAERLVGIAVPDFYGAYLDQRLATARQSL